MKLLKFEVTNFGSYKHLEFDLTKKGLGLIYGPTGAGKSTIPDIPCWILFGVTAKDGNVDEICSWQTPGEVTKGILHVEIDGYTLVITRIRGKAQQNDLYWQEPRTLSSTRGKDLLDTQNLLNNRLNLSADTYIAGSYFHEFTKSGSFFQASAKSRRAVLEEISDLALPIRVGAKAKEKKSELRKQIQELEPAVSFLEGKVSQLDSSLKSTRSNWLAWQKNQQVAIKNLKARATTFEDAKAKSIAHINDLIAVFEKTRQSRILKYQDQLKETDHVYMDYDSQIADARGQLDALGDNKCTECGGPRNAASATIIRAKMSKLVENKFKLESNLQKRKSIEDNIRALSVEDNPHSVDFRIAQASTDNTGVLIEREKKVVNPFSSQLEILEGDIAEFSSLLNKKELQVIELMADMSDLDFLEDVSDTLRGVLLHKTISEVEYQTNRYLETYFDAELRVSFALDSDNLDVTIQNNGYECVYRQLSKGQRGLLKLCFVASIMKAAANKSMVHFSHIFMDEALDGLDNNLKIKAFAMLEELALEHDSVLVIEHAPEFQNLFHTRYRVTMANNQSQIEILGG